MIWQSAGLLPPVATNSLRAHPASAAAKSLGDPDKLASMMSSCKLAEESMTLCMHGDILKPHAHAITLAGLTPQLDATVCAICMSLRHAAVCDTHLRLCRVEGSADLSGLMLMEWMPQLP